MPAPNDPVRPADDEALVIVAGLLRRTRAGVLATADAEGPYAAMVAFAPEPGWQTLIIHLSNLSAHKRHLLADRRAAMLVARPDDGRTEILQHPRLTLRCSAELLDKGALEFVAARLAYLGRYPRHEITFGLPDFDLFRLAPRSGLLNAGFGKAYAITPADLAAAARIESPPDPPAAGH